MRELRRATTLAALALALAACGGMPTPDDVGGIDAGADTDASVVVDAYRPPIDASVRDALVSTDALSIDAAPDDVGIDAHCANDGDLDGYIARACGGDDCDDTDASRHPGASETCDDVDQDCDDRVDEGLAGCVAVACQQGGAQATVCVGTPCCTDWVYPPCGACNAFAWGSTVPCDGPEDCGSGLGCCVVPAADRLHVDAYACSADCAGSWLCHDDGDCPSEHPHCVPPAPDRYPQCTG